MTCHTASWASRRVACSEIAGGCSGASRWSTVTTNGKSRVRIEEIPAFDAAHVGIRFNTEIRRIDSRTTVCPRRQSILDLRTKW